MKLMQSQSFISINLMTTNNLVCKIKLHTHPLKKPRMQKKTESPVTFISPRLRVSWQKYYA